MPVAAVAGLIPLTLATGLVVQTQRAIIPGKKKATKKTIKKPRKGTLKKTIKHLQQDIKEQQEGIKRDRKTIKELKRLM